MRVWSLRGVVGTGLNDPMSEEQARALLPFYARKRAYIVFADDGGEWKTKDTVRLVFSTTIRKTPVPAAPAETQAAEPQENR